jgi:hypothetical protein
MLQDVDQFSERIADVEPAHPPRLARRAVFDRDTGFSDSRHSRFDIVDFDREIRHGGAGSSSDITLICTVIFALEP